MTMYWRWVASSRPKSKTWTMLGCTSRAAASASRRKRATNWSSSARCSASSLTATSRSRRSSKASYDGRHAADAEALAQLVAAGEDLAGHHGVVTRAAACRRCRCRCRSSCRSSWSSRGPGRVVRWRPGVGPGGARVGRRRCRWSACRSSPVSVVLVSVWRLAASASARLAARRGTRSARFCDARLQALAQAARRPWRAGSSTVVLGLITARCAAVAAAARGSRTRSGSSGAGRGSTRRSAGIRPSLPPQATSRAVASAERRARRAAAGRRILTDRTPGARPASRAAARRGSRPRRPAMSYSIAPLARRSRRSVSSSSQAARGSPSRGWPTLPGLSSHSPSARSTSSPPRRAARWPARPRGARTTARRASGRRGRGARAGRRGTARPAARRARTPTPGRAG